MQFKSPFALALALGVVATSLPTSNPVSAPTRRSSLKETANNLAVRRPFSPSKVGSLNRRSFSSDSSLPQTNLTSVLGGTGFTVEVSFDSQSFDLILDTGSSDFLVVAANFTCLNSTDLSLLPQTGCGFADLYEPSSNLSIIPNQHFNHSYGGTLAPDPFNGYLAYENVIIAGINVPNQEIAIIEVATDAQSTEGTASGILGMAFPNITDAFYGTDPTGDVLSERHSYPPLLQTMYHQGLINPVFSLAISRDPLGKQDGGVLSLGGVPKRSAVRGGYGRRFATVPMQRYQAVDGSLTSANYSYYSIEIDGVSFGSTSSELANDTQNTQTILDSGSTTNFIPSKAAKEFNSLFSPPAKLDPESGGVYTVQCNATPSAFDVSIGGHVFPTNPADLIVSSGDPSVPVCLSGVQDIASLGPRTAGSLLLGDVFMKNVLAVFDVGDLEMSFASRVNY